MDYYAPFHFHFQVYTLAVDRPLLEKHREEELMSGYKNFAMIQLLYNVIFHYKKPVTGSVTGNFIGAHFFRHVTFLFGQIFFQPFCNFLFLNDFQTVGVAIGKARWSMGRSGLWLGPQNL